MPTQPTTNNLEGWEEKWWKLWRDFTNHIRSDKEVFQFIKDLRQADEEALINFFKENYSDYYSKDIIKEIKDCYNINI